MQTEPIPILLLRGKSDYLKIPVVAEGLITTDGRAFLAWLGEHRSVSAYESVRDLYEVHCRGHRGTFITTLDRGAELSLDPWHAGAIASALEQSGRVPVGVITIGDATPTPSPDGRPALVWLKMDWCGNAIGVIGPAMPPD